MGKKVWYPKGFTGSKEVAKDMSSGRNLFRGRNVAAVGGGLGAFAMYKHHKRSVASRGGIVPGSTGGSRGIYGV